MQRAEVKRDAIRSRREINPLEGFIEAEIEVCSKEKHGVESYLHIASGDIELEYDRNSLESEINQILRQYGRIQPRDIDRLVKHMEIKNFMSFNKLKDITAGKETLAIPGSSIKGNIRSRLELTLVPREGEAIACITYYTYLQREPFKGTHGWRHYRIWREALKQPRGARCDATKQDKVCLVCNLFGAPGLASLINIGTFYQTSQDNRLKELKQRGERILAAKPGTVFRGEIYFRGLHTHELGLLLIGMGQSEKGSKIVLLGKHKYAPFAGKLMGRIVYNITKVKITERCTGDDKISSGATYEENNISNFIFTCLNAAQSEYGDYLHVINEHEKTIEVNRT